MVKSLSQLYTVAGPTCNLNSFEKFMPLTHVPKEFDHIAFYVFICLPLSVLVAHWAMLVRYWWPGKFFVLNEITNSRPS